MSSSEPRNGLRQIRLVTSIRAAIYNGQSGASLIRPALERLPHLAAVAAIDVVYLHAPDRLIRSYAHQAVPVEEFARADGEIVFLNRPIGQTPENTLLLQLQGMFANYGRGRIIERSRRGKRHLAKAGAASVLGRAPHGYRFISRAAGSGVARFEVVENEAVVVRRIFQWIAQERASQAVVCQRLFEAGKRKPRYGLGAVVIPPKLPRSDRGRQPDKSRGSVTFRASPGTVATLLAQAAGRNGKARERRRLPQR